MRAAYPPYGTLMVVGFIFGAMVCDLMTEFVMLFMPMAIQNANADSWVGIIKMGGLIAVFVIILQMVVNLSFQMIRFIPDQVLGWLGGNMQNQIGANAQDEVGSAAKNSIGARGTVSAASGKQNQMFQQKKADKQHKELVNANKGANPANPDFAA